MLKVTCNLCENTGRKTELVSNVIAKNEQEGLKLIAMEMAKHIEVSHNGEIGNIMKTTIEVQALLAMLCFSSDDEGFNDETERVRNSVLEAVTKGMAEDEEDEDDDTDDDTDSEDEMADEEDEEEGIDGLER